jgi:hypothetical protein
MKNNHAAPENQDDKKYIMEHFFHANLISKRIKGRFRFFGIILDEKTIWCESIFLFPSSVLGFCNISLS